MVSKARRGNLAIVDTPPGDYGERKHAGSLIKRDETGITVQLDENDTGPRIPKKGDFDENLAEVMEDQDRKALARRLKEYLEIDKDSRKDWYQRGLRGLALMGITDVNKENKQEDIVVNSPGQANIKMPLMAEAVTHFQARAIAELCPATGPVKAQIIGPRTKERVDQADRIETFSNYYLMTVDKGYFPDTDQMLLYLPISGSVFRKAAQSWVTGMPELRYVKADNFIAPYAAKDLDSATRYAHEYNMSGQDIRRAVESKMFRKVDLKRPAVKIEAQQTADKSDSRILSEHEDDANYPVIEYHIDMELPIDPLGTIKSLDIGGEQTYSLLSYIVIVESENEEVLMIRRNWKKEDKLRRRRQWFAHHKFFPGVGFYGWGYPHLLGSLQKAASDGVNALLDAGFANNFQGGFATKEAKAAGLAGDLTLEHGVYKSINASIEDLSKALWSPDFHPPSPALTQMVEKLIETFHRFASITETAVGDADNRGPVGTTLALIEQSNIIPTAIHKRLHFSMGIELCMWAELVYDYMPNRYEYEIAKETKFLLREDFDGRVDVVPVSDPNIWSQKQRITLCQTVMQMQTQAPDLYQVAQRIEAHRRLMQAMRVPDIEGVAPQVSQPKYLDPIAENGLIMVGSGVRAFEPQDHSAHMQVHEHGRQMTMNSPYFANLLPEKQQAVLSGYDAHQAEHMALYYRRLVMQTSGIPLPPLDESGMEPSLPPDVEAQITSAVVQKLPPLPTPQPKQDGTEQQAAELTAKARADIQARSEESRAKIARDSEAFVAEQSHAEEAHKAELRRLDEASQAEEQRKDTSAATEIVRDGAKSSVTLDAKQREAQLKLGSKEAETTQKLEHADRKIDQELQHKDAKSTQELGHKDAKAVQEVDHKDAKHTQDMQHTEQSTTQELKHAEKRTDAEIANKEKGASVDRANTSKAARVERDNTKLTAEQERALKDQAATQDREHKDRAMQQDLQHKDRAAKQTLTHSEQAGKLKLRQTKEQLAAKKAKNKTASKK